MKPYLKYGLISAITGICITLLVYVLGWDKSPSGRYLGWLSFPVTIVLMVMCVRECRQTLYEGFISFGQAFKNLFLMILISSVLAALFMYVYTGFINPSLIDYILEQQELAMEERGMDQSQIDQAIAISKIFITPLWMSIWSFFIGLLISAVIALIIAAVMKKENPEVIR
jgi:ABC-type nitrate/sulfonate/bicarbonate transport system permease component